MDPPMDHRGRSLLETGIMYVHKRDKFYHPILIVNAERLFVAFNDISVDKLRDLACYIYNFAADKLMLPGRVEQWSIIVDLRRTGNTF